MKKRPNNNGSIYYDKNRSLWYASMTDPNTGKRIKSKGSTDQQEVIDWLTAKSAAVLNGTYVTPNKLTISAWMLSYLMTYVKQNVRPKSWLGYLQTAEHLSPLADIKLQKLTPLIAQSFFNSLTMASSTKKKIYGLLNQALKQAVLVRLISSNPLAAVKPPRVVQEEVEIFTKDEINKVLTVLRTPPPKGPVDKKLPPDERKKIIADRIRHRALMKRYPFVLLAVTTGARLGELIGLRWSDFSKADGTISIKRSMQSINGRMVEMPPKTKAGTRVIPIPEEVVAALQKLRISAPVMSMDGFIFKGRNSESCMRPYNFNRIWHKILKLADVPYRKFHAIRHTHATELLASGVPILEVSRRLDHAKASHTLNLYGHAIPSYSSVMVEKVSELYNIK